MAQQVAQHPVAVLYAAVEEGRIIAGSNFLIVRLPGTAGRRRCGGDSSGGGGGGSVGLSGGALCCTVDMAIGVHTASHGEG